MSVYLSHKQWRNFLAHTLVMSYSSESNLKCHFTVYINSGVTAVVWLDITEEVS